MRLPNAENAIIDSKKLRDYVLSLSHPIGRFKAAFFSSLGYSQKNWKQLETDLRQQHLPKNTVFCQKTSYGKKYEIHGKIRGPNGKSEEIVSIWIILVDEKVPRFVTAYPGGNR